MSLLEVELSSLAKGLKRLYHYVFNVELKCFEGRTIFWLIAILLLFPILAVTAIKMVDNWNDIVPMVLN